ncbi:hypothetical protein VCSRO74_3131 [Vibrio cholerae]|nr:hypothetical protein VCSRO74_3131 [Vibrio cholerae]GHZ64006.1 hypothetical protein VCSRO80_3275 [Vibrio cholerae]
MLFDYELSKSFNFRLKRVQSHLGMNPPWLFIITCCGWDTARGLNAQPDPDHLPIKRLDLACLDISIELLLANNGKEFTIKVKSDLILTFFATQYFMTAIDIGHFHLKRMRIKLF